MPRVLLVKTSSLGDVVHNLPVASDIAARFPGADIDWVVESPFAAIPALHARVRRTLAVGVRRWRMSAWREETRREVQAFIEALRAERYDAVIDTQGLFKSAIITRLARGRRYGLDWKASREPLFPFYDRTIHVPRRLHAVERNRRLACDALAYELPRRLDYGLTSTGRDFAWLGATAYAVLLHATSAEKKLWLDARWIALGRALTARGLTCVLPWGAAEEQRRAERLAGEIDSAVVAPQMTVSDLASLLAGARCVAGVDTGLTHLAGALGVPTVGIFVATSPGLTGLYGCARGENVGARGAPPSADDVLQALEKLAA